MGLLRQWRLFIARLNAKFDASRVATFFHIAERNTCLTTELRAGTVTFLTMAYILSVNANIIADSGGTCTSQDCTGPDKRFDCRFKDPGFRACVDVVRVSLITATAASSMIGCFVMGIAANLPFALAPSMGLNAYFTYTVVGFYGTGQVSYRDALAAVFIEGLLFIVLSITGVRQGLVALFPRTLALSMAAGIGLFLAMVGLQTQQGIGLVTGDPTTLLTLGGCEVSDRANWYTLPESALADVCTPDPETGQFPNLGPASKNWSCQGNKLTNGPTWLGLGGLALIAILMSRNIKGAVVIGIVCSTIIAWIPGTSVSYLGPSSYRTGGITGTGEGRLSFFRKVVNLPSLQKTGLALRFDGIGSSHFWIAVFTFLYVDFFDASGTLFSMANFIGAFLPGFVNDKKLFPRSTIAYCSDGVAIVAGALMGTSPVTVFIESATGIREGGRTGITAVVTGLWFFVAMWFSPILASIPVYCTGPAVIIAGSLMMVNVTRIDWTDLKDAIPAFLTMVLMPFTYSIAYGVIAGIVAYLLGHGSNKALDWIGDRLKKVRGLNGGDDDDDEGFGMGQRDQLDLTVKGPTGMVADGEASHAGRSHTSSTTELSHAHLPVKPKEDDV